MPHAATIVAAAAIAFWMAMTTPVPPRATDTSMSAVAHWTSKELTAVPPVPVSCFCRSLVPFRSFAAEARSIRVGKTADTVVVMLPPPTDRSRVRSWMLVVAVATATSRPTNRMAFFGAFASDRHRGPGGHPECRPGGRRTGGGRLPPGTPPPRHGTWQ
jgi:hypothetical protein